MFMVVGGATGTIIFDESADRVPDFWMFSFMANNTFAIVAETITTRTGSTTTRVSSLCFRSTSIAFQKSLMWPS